MIRRLFTPASLFLAGLLMIGCGGADGLNRGGELTGKVTIDDKPLLGGRVEITSEDGKNAVSAQLRPDGTYTLKEPPLGSCKITVTTSYLKGMVPPPRAGKTGNKEGASGGMVYPDDVGFTYVPIPAKYESASTTDLQVTVAKGNQSHDIKLTSK